MQTLTEMVAAVVLHSSAVAYSHFGVAIDAPAAEKTAPPPAAERTVARSAQATPTQVAPVQLAPVQPTLGPTKKAARAAQHASRTSDCPQAPRPHLVKA